MNKQRRTAIEEIQQQIETLKEDLELLMGEEQEYFDNMPESFQYGEKGSKSESAISALEDAISSIDDISGYLETARE